MYVFKSKLITIYEGWTLTYNIDMPILLMSKTYDTDADTYIFCN